MFYRVSLTGEFEELFHATGSLYGTAVMADDGRICYDTSYPFPEGDWVECRMPDGAIEQVDIPLSRYDIYQLAFDASGDLYAGGTGEMVARIEPDGSSSIVSITADPIKATLTIGQDDSPFIGLYNAWYTYDAGGRIASKVEASKGGVKGRTYIYDAAGRLEEVREGDTTIETNIYDDNGNRVQVERINDLIPANYDDQDRMLTFGDNSYTYTANGELTTKTNIEGTTQYHYDTLGNLISVTLPDGTFIEYLIDGLNRRIGKKVNGSLGQGFLYKDQLNPIAELDGAGNIVARFVYADKANIPAYMIRIDPNTDTEATYRILSDHLGSPRIVVNVETGEVAQEIEYDTWGQVVSDSNPGFQPFGFAGGLYDGETGLVRFGARDYDPETGRWTSKDPILFAGGDTNLYGYCVNDPVNFVDLIGLEDIAKTKISAKGELYVEYYEPYYRMHPTVQKGVDIHEQVHKKQLSGYFNWGYGLFGGRWGYFFNGPKWEVEAYEAQECFLENELKKAEPKSPEWNAIWDELSRVRWNKNEYQKMME